MDKTRKVVDLATLKTAILFKIALEKSIQFSIILVTKPDDHTFLVLLSVFNARGWQVCRSLETLLSRILSQTLELS